VGVVRIESEGKIEKETWGVGIVSHFLELQDCDVKARYHNNTAAKNCK
jgi:hypothetical protein